MKTTFALLFVLSFIGLTQAQTKEDLASKDPKAKAILDKLSATNKTDQAMRVKFAFNLENKDQKINETQKGTLLFKGNRFKIDMDKVQIVSDNKTRWTFIKSSKEVQVDHANNPESSDAIEPSKIFTMHEKNHKYKYVGTEKINNVVHEVVKLFPEEVDKKSFHTVILYINKSNSNLTKAKILSKDGNTYTYTIEKKEVGVAVKDADFIFDTKKASEVIDLRE
jgi:outer membrane lipoprotein-sorting protein